MPANILSGQVYRIKARGWKGDVLSDPQWYVTEVLEEGVPCPALEEIWDKSLRAMAAQKLTAQANEWLADNDQTDQGPEKDPITEEELTGDLAAMDAVGEMLDEAGELGGEGQSRHQSGAGGRGQPPP